MCRRDPRRLRLALLAALVVPGAAAAQSGGATMQASVTVLAVPAVAELRAAGPEGASALDRLQVRGAASCRVLARFGEVVREADCVAGGMPPAWRAELARRAAAGERVGVQVRFDAGT